MLKDKLKNIKDNFKNIFVVKEGENNKKKIENLVVFAVILIITIIIINVIWNSDKEDEKEGITNTDKVLAKSTTNVTLNKNDDNTYNLEEKLEDILEKIVGVGKVKVLLTYSQTSTTVAMYNEDSTKSGTEETDSRRRKQENRRDIN